MLFPRALVPALLACLALVVAACGGGSSSSSGSGSGSSGSASTGTQASTTQAAAKPPLEQQHITTDLESKPSIAPGQGKPPTTLLKQDVVKGKGKVAKAGDKVSVQYVGVSWSNGAQFDASWDRGQSFDFQLGAGNVIKGWDQGVKGMRVGGRRMLIIPPGLAYGAQGSPPSIGPDETLIFVIDLEKVTSG